MASIPDVLTPQLRVRGEPPVAAIRQAAVSDRLRRRAANSSSVGSWSVIGGSSSRSRFLVRIFRASRPHGLEDARSRWFRDPPGGARNPPGPIVAQTSSRPLRSGKPSGWSRGVETRVWERDSSSCVVSRRFRRRGLLIRRSQVRILPGVSHTQYLPLPEHAVFAPRRATVNRAPSLSRSP